MVTKPNTDNRVSDQDHVHVAGRKLICYIHSVKLFDDFFFFFGYLVLIYKIIYACKYTTGHLFQKNVEL